MMNFRQASSSRACSATHLRDDRRNSLVDDAVEVVKFLLFLPHAVKHRRHSGSNSFRDNACGDPRYAARLQCLLVQFGADCLWAGGSVFG